MGIVVLAGALLCGREAQTDDAVGYFQEWVADAESGRQILLDVFEPLDAEVAEQLPTAHFEYYVPVPFPTPGDPSPPGFLNLPLRTSVTTSMASKGRSS